MTFRSATPKPSPVFKPRSETLRAGNAVRDVRRLRSVVMLAIVFIVAFIVVIPFDSAISSSLLRPRAELLKLSADHEVVSSAASLTDSHSTLSPTFRHYLPTPQLPGESIQTFASDCVTPKTDFNLGEIVCAKVTGAPISLFPWKVLWLDSVGFVEQSAIADDGTTYQFTLPSNATSVVNGQLIDNRGTWQVNLVRSSGSRRQSAVFMVHDPAEAIADLFVQKFIRSGDGSVALGGPVTFVLVIGNLGPDTAQNVHVVDSAPGNLSLLSFTQQSGPACTPAGASDCTIASLAQGQQAEFTAIYDTATAAAGTVLTSATVSSETNERDNNNNTKDTKFEITAGSGGTTCNVTCPTSPQPVNNEPGTNGAHVSFDPPVTTGTCGSLSTSATSGAFFPIGVSTVTASTESGESCAFVVTVNDNENPTISCPANISAFESSQGSASAIVNYSVTANDNSGAVMVDCSQPSGSSFSLGTTQVTCTATDEGGNTDSCSFNVTVNTLNTTCTLTAPAGPIIVDSAANTCGANVTYNVGIGESCGTVTCDRPSGSFFAVGETLVTCTSSDGASTNFTVTVNDSNPPIPNVPSLPTITSDCAVSLTIPPTATDDCGGQIGGTTDDPRSYQDPGTFTVNWIYTDSAGNTATQTQTVIVTGNDTTAPVPNLSSLPTITGECSASITTTPTATDNCSGEIVGTTSDPLTFTGAGTYVVHWVFTDQSGNSSQQDQTVVVTDTEAPTIELVGAGTVTVECHTGFTDPGVHTTDNCIPENVTVATSGTVDVNAPGTYTVNYTATDGGGNQASTQRTVIVVDTTSPVLTLNGANPLTVECHTSFTDPGATANDSCDSSVPVTISGAVDVNVPGTYVLTYNASDDSGNAATTLTRTINVVDTTAPTISCPANIVVYLPVNTTDTSMSVTYPIVTASDSCSSNVAVTSTPASGSVFSVGSTTVMATATDPAGNSSSCSFTVTVLYNFSGFFSPVNNLPILNSVNAGRAVPVKFSLSGDKGLNIFAPNNPYSVSFNCDTSDPGVDVTETLSAGNSSLEYDSAADKYQYVWKTQGSWAGTCRRLVLTLNDGSVHVANFRFR